MGLTNSYMECIDKSNACAVNNTQRIPYAMYHANQSKFKQQCANNQLQQCCAPSDTDTLDPSGTYANKIYATDGTLIAYNVCKCDKTDQHCISTNCVNFAQATKYDTCKFLGMPDKTKSSVYVNYIPVSIPDCHTSCKNVPVAHRSVAPQSKMRK